MSVCVCVCLKVDGLSGSSMVKVTEQLIDGIKKGSIEGGR